MLLLTKNGPAKAFCSQCRHLYEATPEEMASAEKKKGSVFVCGPCYRRIVNEAKARERKLRAV